MTDIAGAERKSSIRRRWKFVVYIAIWIIALLLTAPGMWPLAHMFPLGLAAVIDRHSANDGGWGVMIGCYLVYVVHGFFAFVPRRPRER
jgi:hypothetical protein